MQRWKFSEILGFLPLLLHLALAIFFAGLCVYVSRSHMFVLACVGSVAAAAVVFYIVTSALPAVYLDCRYWVSIILLIPVSACVYAWTIFQFVAVNQICGRVKWLFVSIFSANGSATLPPDHISRPSFAPSSLAKQEHGYIKQKSFRSPLPHPPYSPQESNRVHSSSSCSIIIPQVFGEKLHTYSSERKQLGDVIIILTKVKVADTVHQKKKRKEITMI